MKPDIVDQIVTLIGSLPTSLREAPAIRLLAAAALEIERLQQLAGNGARHEIVRKTQPN